MYCTIPWTILWTIINTKLKQTESQDHLNTYNFAQCEKLLLHSSEKIQTKWSQCVAVELFTPSSSFLCFLFSMLHPKRLNVAKLHLHFMLIHVEHFPRQTLVLILFDKML